MTRTHVFYWFLVCAGTCKLSWYTPGPPSFGNTVLCSGAGEACLEPCSSGYEMLQGAGACVQKCPDENSGPSHFCPVTRACVRGAGSLCPVLSDVPYSCTTTDAFISECMQPDCMQLLGYKMQMHQAIPSKQLSWGRRISTLGQHRPAQYPVCKLKGVSSQPAPAASRLRGPHLTMQQ
jgi:hypothetical protein